MAERNSTTTSTDAALDLLSVETRREVIGTVPGSVMNAFSRALDSRK
jgi:hypothetical protein